MHNDWFQFTDISFPLLLISRMLSRIQPCISVIPIQEWNVSIHVCIIVSVEIEFYRSNQFLSPVTWLKSEYRAHRSLTSDASFDWKRERYERIRDGKVCYTKIIINTKELYLELETDKKKTIFVEISLELNPLKHEIVGVLR